MREDWVECELGEIADKITKGSTPTTYGYKFQESGINFIKIENVKNGKVDKKSIINFISEEAHNSQERSKLHTGDILFSIAGTIGETCLVHEDILPANTNQAFAIINGFNEILLPNFLLKQLESFVVIKIKSKARGGAMNNVSLADLKKFEIILPPLPEQRAIVAKIEALFSDLDNGIADLKKAQEQLKIYRQAVLKKAFEGIIIANSKKKKLKEITEKIGSGSTPKGGSSSYKEEGIPLVRSLNIHFDYIKYDGLAYIDEVQANRLNNVIIKKNDVLLNITGASIGRVNIAPKEFENGRVNQHVSIIRSKNNEFDHYFLKYYIQSPIIQFWISNTNYGVTRQALTKDMLDNMEIPLPSLEEQHQIVREIETRLSVCDKLEQSITEALEKADALRQSILKKAFQGSLLNEAELKLCREASDYEPADVLLNRIKTEKTANSMK